MKIFYDDIIFNLQKAGGISVYWHELINRILTDKYDVFFIEHENENNIFRKDLEIPTFKKVKEKNIPINILRYLPLTLKVSPNSIFHSSYYRVSNQKNVLNIVTVHDFTYEYYIKGLAKKIHVIQKKNAIEKADGIICISENTKKDLLKFYPNVNEDKIEVIYNGVSDDFYKIEDSKDEFYEKYHNQKYIMFVGDRSDYKNFGIALNVVGKLKDFKLIIVGGKNLSENELEEIEGTLDGRYEHLKGISNDKLNILYNNAFCLLYPSSYEGFGIPVIEAMKAGCPVIAMNRSSIPEVAGDAGILVDSEDYNEFINEIKKLENKSYRTDIELKGYNQAERFSWKKTYNDTIKFYNKIYNYHG